MSKKLILILLFLSFISLFLISCVYKPIVPSCPDCNVVLIVIDTLRADHLGAYGYERNITPNIDKLAQEGILFKNALAQSSWTKQSTASILTGLYPKNHGANTRKDILDNNNILLSEILKDNGYETHAFIGNGNVNENFGFNQGYDYFKPIRENLSKNEVHVYSIGINKHFFKIFNEINPKSKQFFYIHYIDPHSPYMPLNKYYSKNNKFEFTYNFMKDDLVKLNDSERKIAAKEMVDAYDDEILANDFAIEEVIEKLKEKGIYNKTVVIIVSDHGEEFLEHNGFTHGKTLYNEQLKVPLIIRIPKSKQIIVDEIIEHIDILPTLLKILNINLNYGIDGTNYFDNSLKQNKLSFSELNIDNRIIYSVQNKDNKFIETGIFKTKNSGETENLGDEQFKWFSNKINFKFNGKFLLVDIQGIMDNQSVKISVDNTIGINYPISKQRKILLVPILKKTSGFNIKDNIKSISIEPNNQCITPKNLGINQDIRCLNFRIFNTTLKIDKINEVQIKSEFYNLKNDPLEKIELFKNINLNQEKKELKQELSLYLNDLSNLVNNKSSKEAKINDEQLDVLKALGYLN